MNGFFGGAEAVSVTRLAKQLLKMDKMNKMTIMSFL
jgi:hypothetical protein